MFTMFSKSVYFWVIATVVSFVNRCYGWKSIPANQAVYALRQLVDDDDADSSFGTTGVLGGDSIPDEKLPRTYLHSNYKFGWCTPDATSKRFLHKQVNMTLKNFGDTKLRYIYLLAHKHTQRFRLQCIMMKVYVPRKYLFRRSRLPMYYCQGQVYYLMLNTIQKIELHEFYIQQLVLMPLDFVFEFYHAPPI